MGDGIGVGDYYYMGCVFDDFYIFGMGLFGYEGLGGWWDVEVGGVVDEL